MKKFMASMLIGISLISLVGCTGQQASANEPAVVAQVSYEDGTYRGTFSDSGYMQVGVQFKLENNIVKEAKFRHLEYKGIDYRKEETDQTIVGLKGQFEEALNYLVDKDIRENLADLYEPGNIVKENVDAFTGATVRSSKIISAIRDGLNRGVYSY